MNLFQALAAKAKKIQAENEKFARKFSTPHTSQYTVSNVIFFCEGFGSMYWACTRDCVVVAFCGDGPMAQQWDPELDEEFCCSDHDKFVILSHFRVVPEPWSKSKA